MPLIRAQGRRLRSAFAGPLDAPSRAWKISLVVIGAAMIFVLDVTTPARIVAVLYVGVVLLASTLKQRRWIVRATVVSLALTILAFALQHGRDPIGLPLARCLVSLGAITLTGVLRLENLSTARQLAERTQLLRLQSDLTHADRMSSLGELSASIAHEVNQPLAGILGNAQAGLRWLRRDPPDLAAVEDSFVRIVADAKRAAAVLARIRGLARKAEPVAEPLNLGELLEETAMLLRLELQRNVITLTLAAPDAPVTVHADRVQMQQVLINLMMNAIQAMAGAPDGRRELNVALRRETEGAVVVIRDTGPGIAEAVQDGLFAPFVTTKTDGMGIGLSICASIIRESGGRISADNAPEGGAIFRFVLPLSEGLPRRDAGGAIAHPT